MKAYGIYNSDIAKNYNVSSIVSLAFFDIGVGSSILIDGRLIQGNSYFAGEVGYLYYNGERPATYLTADTDTDSIAIVAANIIESLTAIVNPATCFLLGEYLSEEVRAKIPCKFHDNFPKTVYPELVYIDNWQEYMKYGLFQIAMDFLL